MFNPFSIGYSPWPEKAHPRITPPRITRLTLLIGGSGVGFACAILAYVAIAAYEQAALPSAGTDGRGGDELGSGASVAALDRDAQAPAGLLPTPEVLIPSATSGESRRPASDRLREPSPEEVMKAKAADERLRKLMIICRGC